MSTAASSSRSPATSSSARPARPRAPGPGARTLCRVPPSAPRTPPARRSCRLSARPGGPARRGAQVKEVLEIGVLLDVAPDVEAFVHISELDDRYIPDARKLFKAGDVMDVKVLRPNDRGGIRASRRALGSREDPPGWHPDPNLATCRGAAASDAARGSWGAFRAGRAPDQEASAPSGPCCFVQTALVLRTHQDWGSCERTSAGGAKQQKRCFSIHAQ